MAQVLVGWYLVSLPRERAWASFPATDMTQEATGLDGVPGWKPEIQHDQQDPCPSPTPVCHTDRRRILASPGLPGLVLGKGLFSGEEEVLHGFFLLVTLVRKDTFRKVHKLQGCSS